MKAFMRLQFIFIFISLLSVACQTKAQVSPGKNWPGFRGYGDSKTVAENLPIKWSETENIAWTADIEGYGQSSPVVWDGKVYISSVEGPLKETLFVHCYDQSSGRLNWKNELKATQKIKNSKMVSRGTPTSAADSAGIYTFFESGDLAAYDHNGKQLWLRSLTKDYGEFAGNHGLGSSLAQTGDAIIILVAHAGPSYLLSIDKKSGKTNWKTDRVEQVSWSSPIVSSYKGQEQILISSNGTAGAYDAGTGKLIWELDDIKRNTVPSPTTYGDLVIIGSSDKGWNLAIDRNSKGKVGKEAIAWKSDIPSSSFASPLVNDEYVYFISKVGMVYCLKAVSGKLLWKHTLKNSAWASPIASGEYLYIFDKTGITTVMKHTDEGPEIISTNTYPCDSVVYGVAAVDGAFIIRMGQKIVCIKNKK